MNQIEPLSAALVLIVVTVVFNKIFRVRYKGVK